ncbi:Hypothetical protein HDN1F_31740 [gamma proteobacterium HdN1]|nr:Hypothetical protein HDN1F_31740 [gamma proteobacterium HdN1]
MHLLQSARPYAKVLLVPIIITAFALISLWQKSFDGELLAVIVLCFVAWGATGLALGKKAGAALNADARSEPLLWRTAELPAPLIRYYIRLLGDWQTCCWAFTQQSDAASASFRRVTYHLERAVALAQSTGLFAANTSLVAGSCGEVGRSFVGVSKNIGLLSQRSEYSLQKLLRLVNLLLARVENTPMPDEQLARAWLEASQMRVPHTFSPEPLLLLNAGLATATLSLEAMRDVLQDERGTDLRSFQLNETLNSVLEELIDHVFNLKQGIACIMANWRILSAFQPLEECQLAEIKKYFDSFEAQPAELA